MSAQRRWLTFRTGCALAVLLIAAACALVGVVARRILSTRMGAVHTYTLPAPPPFLSDALALTKARQAMESEGYSLKLWQPLERRQTKNTQGEIDQFLLRNPTNAASGSITFADSAQSTPGHQRVVEVDLEQNRVSCRIEIPR
jgi:hypothetical protein